MKRLSLLILFIAASWTTLSAQNVEFADEYTLADIQAMSNAQLDTINVKKKLNINDYTMFGVQYGVGLSQVMWNPTQKQEMVFTPVNFGVTFTKYQKMFGYMPYFGFQAGVFYAREGYQFKYNQNNNYIYKVEGAEKALIDVVEAPILFQFHYDMWNFKLMVNIGAYAGYRLGIQRFPGKIGSVNPEYEHAFTPYDRRFDYGLKGGVGFGLVFDPIEIHFMATYKHALSSLYDPDYNSEYYYRFAYPASLVVSAGVHFQLTKRSGKTKASLRKAAKDMVYKTEETYEILGSQSR